MRWVFLLWVLAGIAQAEPKAAKLTKAGVDYRVLVAEPDRVRLVWSDDRGEPLRTFPAIHSRLQAQGGKVLALMNGGIFEKGGIPSGLYVEKGRELRPLNRRIGKGNFYLKPNGVFLISDQGASVIDTVEYPPEGEKIRAAVQSGPLLLRRGKVHPAFLRNSKSRLIRNGVGVDQDGRVVLAITEFHSARLPNLFEFAELFRHLGCRDALFLDGDLSQLATGSRMTKPSNRFASVIVVMAPEG